MRHARVRVLRIARDREADDGKTRKKNQKKKKPNQTEPRWKSFFAGKSKRAVIRQNPRDAAAMCVKRVDVEISAEN